MKDLKRKILIVEDDKSIRFLLKQNLEFEGYRVVEAADGIMGLEMTISEGPDILVLDLMLPRMSGMEVCKKLRKNGNYIPILMLTARGEQKDIVSGLKAGADDYLTKPFNILELTARIESLLRRTGKSGTDYEIYRLGDMHIDFQTGIIRRGDRVIQMKKVECQLLKYLIYHEGKVLTREQIMEDVWEHNYLLSNRTIDTHVTYLRKKIEDNPSKPKYILTVHRVGYRFVKGND